MNYKNALVGEFMKYRLICLLLLVTLLTFMTGRTWAKSEVGVTASAAILMDYTTGETLYQKNASQRLAPASTTKILTAIVAIEHGKQDQEIVASTKASKADGSSIWLAAGECHNLKDLLYGILLSSGNDASVAVAENLAGSEQKFTTWMNTKAKDLGARNSNFVNSNGLPEKEHYTTAYDLALITRYALHNPIFEEIVKTKKKIIAWPGHKWDRIMYNHNKLLWRYEYADGVKTGYTRQAGHCLVSSATKNNHRLIAVVLNSKDVYADSKALFDYGFNHFQLYRIASADEKLGTINVAQGVKEHVSVVANQPINLLIPKGTESKLKINLDLPSSVQAPVERAQPVGELNVHLGGELLEKVPLVAMAPVSRKGLLQRIWDWFTELLQ
ncbi:MAG TPA: D-alanyl-D-alanine carboxypeptidase [Firmicutes bacterium]|jgi:serine-type D-Ala-D-Ala carboxypeptidase (penicillin-binding protein 5/6)|nr:D-alanyl-D-alanine carboxypeptidase [Bacillota bacterium]